MLNIIFSIGLKVECGQQRRIPENKHTQADSMLYSKENKKEFNERKNIYV